MLCLLSAASAAEQNPMNNWNSGQEAGSVDTIKVNELLKLFEQEFHQDKKTAHLYAREAMEISAAIDYQKGLAYSKYYLALIFADYDFELSEEMLLYALDAAVEAGDAILQGKIYNIAGYLKNNLNEFEDALDYFERSLEIFAEMDSDSLSIAVYNNMAISYRRMGNYELALDNYFKAMAFNEALGNQVWLTTNYYNIGYTYMQGGNHTKGLEYLRKGLKSAQENNIQYLFPYILATFGRYYLDTGNYELALEYSHRAFRLAQQQMNRLQESITLNLITDIHAGTGNFDSAYFYQKKISAINDSINQDAQLNQIDYFKMKYQLEETVEQQQLKIKLLEIEEARQNTLITIYIISGLLVVSILIFTVLILRSRMKHKTLEHKALVLEKKNLDLAIEFKNKELAANTIHLMNMNEMISSIGKRVEALQKENVVPNEEVYSTILKELNKNISTQVREEFEIRFREVYTDFYERLNKRFPDLTPNERRLSAFLKLDMSTKDISAITYQSVESLKIARHRLRKKLGLARSDNLATFLNSI